jgi:UDP-apiose/xylose synthase
METDERDFLLQEDSSPLIYGPVTAQRWSYACAKQLIERVCVAYGHERGLRYTIVRPFNFIGPRMDYIPGVDGEGVPRVIACFMDSLMRNKPLQLVDGGRNRRCFTYIDDVMDAMEAMLGNAEKATGEIFNIGHPSNETTIADLAQEMIALYTQLDPAAANRMYTTETIEGTEFYGEGYEDSDRRVPDISKAQRLLGWTPKTGLTDTLRKTISAYIEQYSSALSG